MNPYTTKSQARIRQDDIAVVLREHRMMAAAHLAALERQRGCQAEAEMAWLLERHGLTPPARVSRLAMVRQALGAALVRAGERLAGASQRAVGPEAAASEH